MVPTKIRAKPGSQDDYFQHASTKLPILLKRIPKNYIETFKIYLSQQK
jgi:hypothetical protein